MRATAGVKSGDVCPAVLGRRWPIALGGYDREAPKGGYFAGEGLGVRGQGLGRIRKILVVK